MADYQADGRNAPAGHDMSGQFDFQQGNHVQGHTGQVYAGQGYAGQEFAGQGYAPEAPQGYQQGYAPGFDQGYGHDQAYQQAQQQTYAQGYDQGYDPAYEQGYEQGYQAAPSGGFGGSGSGGGRGTGRLANLAGGVVSLALIAGVMVWGYKLMVRDVSGVPVVQAAEGPMRVQPENPGGMDAEHQGLAVNSVAAVGQAEGPANRLVLAPQPVDVTDEDMPQEALAAMPAAARGAGVDAGAGEGSGAETNANADAGQQPAQPAPASKPASVEELVAQLSQGAAPLSELEPVRVSAPAPLNLTAPGAAAGGAGAGAGAGETTPAAAKPAKPAIKGGLKRSLRPVTRPRGLREASREAAVIAAAAPAPTGAAELDPASLPAGTRLAQLGAFESPQIAKREWDRLDARFGSVLAGKSRVIEKAQSGGRIFYRLRAAGFEDLSDARRFCSVFVAEKVDCIPVVTR